MTVVTDYWHRDVVIDRFWDLVSEEIMDDDGDPRPAPPHPVLGTPCRIWCGGERFAIAARRRGKHGRYVYVVPHRFSYALYHHDDDPSFEIRQVRHLCGDDRCVAGTHLALA